jgi:type VI secretion system protein ImpA
MTSPAVQFDLLAPIPGDNPSGQNLRYGALYDDVRRARRADPAEKEGKDKAAAFARAARIQATIEPCLNALATETKDLQIAVWVADALIVRDGCAGLLQGLQLIRGLLLNFWDTLYPVIEDRDLEARASLLEWLGKEQRLSDSPVSSVRRLPITADGRTAKEYADSLIPAKDQRRDDTTITAKDFDESFGHTPKAFYKQQLDEITHCLTALADLDQTVDSKFGKDAPSFSDLRSTLEDLQSNVNTLLDRKREKEPDMPEKPPTAPQATPTGDTQPSPVPANLGALVSPAPAPAELNGTEAVHLIVAGAHALRKNSPEDVRPYLVLRAFRWGELRSRGTELDTTLLAAPTTEIRVQLRSLAAGERWAELLEVSEIAMGTECGRGWLDLQRYSILACEKLGYTAAATALVSELKCLLDSYPALASSTLLDDTGTANPVTTAWISSGMRTQA